MRTSLPQIARFQDIDVMLRMTRDHKGRRTNRDAIVVGDTGAIPRFWSKAAELQDAGATHGFNLGSHLIKR